MTGRRWVERQRRRAAPPAIFVVGAEGSGSTALWRCVIAHPALRGRTTAQAPTRGRRMTAGVIMHLSLPTLRPMVWVSPDDLPAGSKVIMVRRSPMHTVYSAYRRFYDDPAAAWRNYFHALRLEERYVTIHDPVCVSYEDLVCHPAKVLRAVYEALGLRGDFRPSIRLRNRNDDRWRGDAAFARFMQSAFGGLDAEEPLSAPRKMATKPVGRERPRNRIPARPAVPPPALPESGQGVPRVLPARYVRIDELLAPREHARLLAYARTHEPDFAASSVISADRAFRVEPEFRRSGTLSDVEAVWDMFDVRLRRLLPHVRRELGLPWFPLGRVERQMAVHRDGGFFRAHADNTDAAVAGRCVTCVYYFHAHPKRFTGGELRLYDTMVRGARAERSNSYVNIDPADNTAVFFASDVYHEVRPVAPQSTAFGARRFSINVWFWLGETPQCLEAPLDAPVAAEPPSLPALVHHSTRQPRGRAGRAASRI
jgi:hypothetical protein